MPATMISICVYLILKSTTKQISRRTLMKEPKARYQTGEAGSKITLQDHINTGPDILTTDGWAGNNNRSDRLLANETGRTWLGSSGYIIELRYLCKNTP
jgi:hypothetical protein